MKQLMDWLSNSHWTPDREIPLLLTTALFPGIHLSSTGLEKADGAREPRSKKRTKRTCDAGAPIVRRLLCRIQKASTPALLPALTLQLLRPLRSGSTRQLLGWPFCCPGKSFKDTRILKSPTWPRQPVQTTLHRLKTNAEDSLSRIREEVSQHSCVWGSVWVWQPVH